MYCYIVFVWRSFPRRQHGPLCPNTDKNANDYLVLWIMNAPLIRVNLLIKPAIAYREQLHPQRIVGTIGSVWQESTPSKEITGPAQTNTQSIKNHQEGHPLDSNQLTTCEGRPTKTWRLDSPWWCVAESRTEWPKEKEWMFTTKLACH